MRIITQAITLAGILLCIVAHRGGATAYGQDVKPEMELTLEDVDCNGTWKCVKK